MRGEVIPALLAVSGGVAALGAIEVSERRQARRLAASRQALAAVFPAGVRPEAAVAALGGLSGLGSRLELVSEVIADVDGVRHRLHVPEPAIGAVTAALTGGLPGLRLDSANVQPSGPVTAGVRLIIPAGALLRSDNAVAAGRALLVALSGLRSGERVALRWALRPAAADVDVAGAPPTSAQARAEQAALRSRAGRPGFHVVGLLLVRAADPGRARALLEQVTSVLRARRGVGRGVMVRRVQVRDGAVLPGNGRRRGWLSAGEVLPLLGWPLGDDLVAGVSVGATRQLPAAQALPRSGRELLIGRDARGPRPVALSPQAALHHLAVVGKSGTGKSTLLTRGIVSDLTAGFGGVLIDPKHDLVCDVLDRVPAEHADRVVLLDPAQRGPVPGIDWLGVGDPDLRTDVVVGTLAALYRSAWGVRTESYLRLGLRTLAEQPEPVLTDWLRLFTDAGFRRQAVSRLRDPLLVAAWASYEALSPAEQHQHVAAPMSRVMSLLSRPAVRAVLSQRDPKLDIARLLGEGKWLLVSLSPGTLGEPAARLLGAVLTYAVWAAIEARAALPQAQRRPVFVYLDELQTLSALPFGLEYLFERARGLGCGVTVATQALGRLPESLRQALLGNAGSLVAFRCGHDEAVRLARELPGLSAADLQGLDRFEVAARLGTGIGSPASVVTGQTLPPPEPAGQAERIRANSSQRYGGRAAAVDPGSAAEASDDADLAVGRRRRS